MSDKKPARPSITVRKLDHAGREVWRYTGTVISRGPTWVQLEAPFNHSDKDEGFVVFRQGDRFVEWHYTDRWYNIFEVHDVDDDHLKGWYCNMARPVVIGETGDNAITISGDDLALDVWVDPAGTILVVDEDDFEALPLDAATRRTVLNAVEELRGHVTRRETPFNAIQ